MQVNDRAWRATPEARTHRQARCESANLRRPDDRRL